MDLDFSGEVFEWRGPAPFYFVAVPEPEADLIHEVANVVTYGWGCIPATITIGRAEFTTSLFPKDGGYLVGIKAAVRKAQQIDLGDNVTMRLSIALP